MFTLDSRLAILERNCPFGFLLVVFWLCALSASFFPFGALERKVLQMKVIVSIPDHCLPFYSVYARGCKQC